MYSFAIAQQMGLKDF